MLAKYYTITSDTDYDRERFLARLIDHIVHGQQLIQLRAKSLSGDEFITVAKQAITIGRRYQAKIILNSTVVLATELDADGVHLTSRALMQCNQRPVANNKLLSVACHNLQQLIHAEKIGADFATLSPVLATQTHPDATPLGWEKFSAWVKNVNIPVYALGGQTQAHLTQALNNGACGIAAITALWDKNYQPT